MDSDWAPIAEICRRLDGLPLALELAAARLPLLGATEVAARLDEGLRLLNIGQRTAPARHQTLRATLQWDYDMLNVAERTLFRRLSVFGGAFDAAAAAAVCPDDDVAPHQVVSLLAQLVQRALVGVQHSEDGTAHRLLEIIRLGRGLWGWRRLM